MFILITYTSIELIFLGEEFLQVLEDRISIGLLDDFLHKLQTLKLYNIYLLDFTNFIAHLFF